MTESATNVRLPQVSPVVTRLPDAWYAVCASRELRQRPISVRLFGNPMVLFRDENGSPGALLDRCPHRNAPLSQGSVIEGQLECPYHGWRFDGLGACRRVPGLQGEAMHRGRAATSYPTVEQDGFVWVYGRDTDEPKGKPFSLPFLDDGRYHHVRATIDMEGSLHAAAENALDVPHTAFLHRGLFRTAQKKNPVEVIVRTRDESVEAEYVGEPRPSGVMGRLLAPGGGVVTHFDRFILPCVAQVEYGLGEKTHLIATTLLTPIDDYLTRMFGVVSFRAALPLPRWLVSLVVKPIAMKVLRQDAAMLKSQTAVIRHFGTESYVSTEIDAVGPQIVRLLKFAERGETVPEKTRRYTLEL